METTITGIKLLSSWKKTDRMGPTGYVYLRNDGLKVIETTSRHEDGREWLHISMSRMDRIPDYEDITTVKRLFAGRDKKAIMVFPDEKHHVNIHNNCLHLFVCLSPKGDGLPEFSGNGSI